MIQLQFTTQNSTILSLFDLFDLFHAQDRILVQRSATINDRWDELL
jgi:hypothetical protein